MATATDTRPSGGAADQVVGPTDLQYNVASVGTPPPAPAPAPAPINRTVDPTGAPAPSADPASQFLDTFRAPQTADQIAEEKRKSAQGEIDAINKTFDDTVAQHRQQGDQRLAANNAVSIASGLMGGTEAVRTNNAVSDANQKDIDAVNNQRSQQLATIYAKISDDARTEARQQVQDATLNAEDIVKRRADAAAKTIDDLKTMAASGLVNYDSFKSSPQNADVYAHALAAVGGSEDQLKALFLLNRPQDQIVGTPQRMGDKYVQAYKNPITNKVSYESVDLPAGLGQNYTNFQKLGDNLVAIPDGWNGDTSQLKTIIGPPDQLKQAQLQGALLDNQKKQADLSSNSPDNLGQQLVNGLLAPSELSKRTSGTSSYNAVLKAADDYSMQTTGKHFDIAKADRDYKFATNTGTQNTLNYLGSLVGGPGQTGNLDDLVKLSDSIAEPTGWLGAKTNFPALNNVQAWTKLQTGDPQMAAYYATVTEVSDQIAKVLQGGGTGSGTSDAKLNQAQSLFQTGFSKEQIRATADALRPLLANRAKGMVGDNPYLSDYADQFGFGKNSASAGASGDLKSQVASQGYDYDKMKADGHTDAEIKAAVGIK